MRAGGLPSVEAVQARVAFERVRPIERSMQRTPVTKPQILAFAIGEIGIHVPFMSIVLFMMYFYTDAAGLSASTAGMIFLVASVWDAITDPPMGWITERTRTRWGRCRPYFLFGALPLSLSLVLVYYVPPLSGAALIAFLLFAHILFRTCFTIVGIPYAAYSARITRDSSARSLIASAKLFFTIAAGTLVAYALLPLVEYFGEGSAAEGFFRASFFLALAPLIFLPITFLGTREPSDGLLSTAHVSLGTAVRTLLGNRAYRVVLVCIGCVIATQVISGAAGLYYFKYVLNDADAAPASMAMSTAVGLVIVPLWVWVERGLGKRGAWTLAVSCGLAVLGYFWTRDVLSTREFTAICVLLNAALYGATVSMWSMLPDTIEFGELRAGVRVEAPTFGFALFMLKLAMGGATALSGTILERTGFVPNATLSASALDGLTFVAAGLPMAVLAIGLIAGGFYPMRKGDHERIVADLAARASNSGSASRVQKPPNDPLTADRLPAPVLTE